MLIDNKIPPLQQGFTLPDVLLAGLLFSITLLGLLNYQRILLQQFTQQRYQQQAWLLAHGALESYYLGQTYMDFSDFLAESWQGKFSLETVNDAECYSIKASISPPVGKQVELARWICQK